MDEFEAALVDAFRTPTDRPGRWEMAARVEISLRRRDAVRRTAVTAATLVGVSIASAILAMVGALGPAGDLAREAVVHLRSAAHEPIFLTLLGLALLAVAVGGVAARDL